MKEVVRGWIGVSIQDLTPETREALNAGDKNGVLIGDVFKGQPAAKAGLKRGDIILSINTIPVKNVRRTIWW
jgi:S1-C subfamily serine protease